MVILYAILVCMQLFLILELLIINFVQTEQSCDFVDEDDQSGFDFDQSRLCALGRSSDNRSAVSWLSSLYYYDEYNN